MGKMTSQRGRSSMRATLTECDWRLILRMAHNLQWCQLCKVMNNPFDTLTCRASSIVQRLTKFFAATRRRLA